MMTCPSEPPQTISATLRALCEHARENGYQLYPIEFFRATARLLTFVPDDQQGCMTAAAHLLIEDEINDTDHTAEAE